MENVRQISFRQRLGQWIDSPGPHRFIIGLIILNAITLGLETSGTVMAHYGGLLRTLEHWVIAIFTLEIALKLIAWDWRFFRNGWNVFDLIIVGASWVPDAGAFAILRSLRILRVLRLLSTLGRLRMIIESLLRAIPSIGWISLLLAMVFYIFGVMGTELFGDRFPEWFGSLGASMYTLFQIMTLESWSMGIARPVMEAYPLAWLYFIPFILISSFTILNVFIGIIVNTMQAFQREEESEREAQAHREREEMLALLQELNRKLGQKRLDERD